MSDETASVYAIRLHRRARQDMEAACQYLETLSGADSAEEWQNALVDALGTLATKPQRCPFAREDRLLKRAVRQFFSPYSWQCYLPHIVCDLRGARRSSVRFCVTHSPCLAWPNDAPRSAGD